LQITPRHVETDRVTENMVESMFRADIAPAGSDSHNHFHFKMNIAGHWRIRKISSVCYQGIGIFLEKEGWFPVWIVSHFDGMIRIVATDTVNAMNRKEFV
jgi:hypothetical protein